MPNLVIYAIPAFVILLLAEIIFNVLTHRDLFEAKDTLSSLAMGIGNVLTGILSKAVVFAAYIGVYQFRLFEMGYAWWAWVLLFFLEDLSYYWFHRIIHSSRYFWASGI